MSGFAFNEMGAVEIVAFINSPLKVWSLDASTLECDPGDWLLVRLAPSGQRYRRLMVAPGHE